MVDISSTELLASKGLDSFNTPSRRKMRKALDMVG